MAEVTKDQLNEIVSRAMGDVMQEVKGQERAFRVSDLHGQLTDLAKVGGAAAWTISYSTASESIAAIRDAAKIGSQAAWTISYSTASAGIEKEKAR